MIRLILNRDSKIKLLLSLTHDRIIRRWSLQFRNGDTNSENQCDRRSPSALDNQYLKTLVEQNPHQCIREMTQINGCQRFKNIGLFQENWLRKKTR